MWSKNTQLTESKKTTQNMRRQWILIGQSFAKTIRTIEDKIIPSRGGEKQT